MTRLKQPSRLALDAQGNIFVVDQGNLRVRRIDAMTNVITTVAGTGMRGFAGDGGPPLMAQFSFQIGENPEPEGGIAIAPDGRMFIADSSNNRIRVIDLAMNTINTFAGTGTAGSAGDGGPAAMAQISSPRDVEIGPDGNLWIADTGNHCVRVVDLQTNAIRTVVGVCGQYGFAGERGPAAQARLQRPFGIAFDRMGHLYVSDTYNNRIRRVVRTW
jgi:DNA-binding beta-propeller fold protein YncE